MLIYFETNILYIIYFIYIFHICIIYILYYVIVYLIYFFSINLQDGFLKTFLDDAKNLSFTECGKHLMESHGISTTHKDVAQEGQTEV